MVEQTTDPKMPAVKPLTPEALQALQDNPSEGQQIIRARLIVDEINHFDESLPLPLIQGLLSPSVSDFFIQVTAPDKIPGAKAHYLHTSYIREVVLLDALPGSEAAQ